MCTRPNSVVTIRKVPQDKTATLVIKPPNFIPSLNSNNTVLSTSVASSGCRQNQEGYEHAHMT